MPEITVTLNAGYEKVNPTNDFGLKYPPLYHQQRTYDELKENDLVINTYNTGTGKTQASLLRLFDLRNEDDNVLFIAPTNELIRQHAVDIENFVKEHKLKFKPVKITGKNLREFEGGDDPGYPVRNPRKLHEIIAYSRSFFPELAVQTPLILVTNPDIFYLCFYSRYSEMDSANLFRDFLVKFKYIVIDEFHYYNAKQLANFLLFFIFSKEYGYFNAGRKICLLSATPDDALFKYLDKIDLKYKLVSPDNEPAESDRYEKIQTLSEIELTIHSGKMHDVLNTNPKLISNLINSEKEGAIISSSLRTIMDINQGMKNTKPKVKIGLITGAVEPKERGKATSYPLVLATPTVDIGYNFKKVNKSRQNIDFVCFDALYGSEFTQRVGRAGRLLGKEDTTHISIAHAFVQEKLYAHLEAGESYDRKEFAKLVKNALGEDNRFYYYIQFYAVLEAFYPLYAHLKRVSEDQQNRVREVFETIRQVFAPKSDATFDGMKKKIRWYDTYQRVIDADKKGICNDFTRRAQKKAAWSYVKYQSSVEGRKAEFKNISKGEITKEIEDSIKCRSNLEEVIEYAKKEYEITHTLFNFRNSDISIRCGIYDPNYLFQNTAKHTEYDLFYVLSHCEFIPISKEKYRELEGDCGNYCEFFVQANRLKTPRDYVHFSYNARRTDQNAFEHQYCRSVTALKGLRIELSNNGYVPPKIRRTLENQYVVCFLSTIQKQPVLSDILKTKRQVSHSLFVTFNSGQVKEYQLILGAQAFLIHAELQGKWKEKTQTTT